MAEALIPRRTINKQEYLLLADITVNTAVNLIDFNGLNIGKAEEILLVSNIVDNSNTNDVVIYINGNTTATNYYVQTLLASGSSVSGAKINYPFITYTATGKKSLSYTYIKLLNDGFFSFLSNAELEYDTSSNRLHVADGISTFTSSSITTIRVQPYFNASNKFGVGTRFQLYKAGA